MAGEDWIARTEAIVARLKGELADYETNGVTSHRQLADGSWENDTEARKTTIKNDIGVYESALQQYRADLIPVRNAKPKL